MDHDGGARAHHSREDRGGNRLTRPRLAFVVTVPVTAAVLLRGQLAYLREQGFDVTVISSPGEELVAVAQREGVETIAVPMAREISLLRDPRSLAALTRTVRQLAPHIVNAGTAKAGLLGMIAAMTARVPVRVYQLRGLRLETEHGPKRAVLAAAERMAAAAANRIVCNSESLRLRYVGDGFASGQKCAVLGAGSSNGVEVERFGRGRWSSRAAELREQLRIPATSPVIGFVGRPVPEKGIGELLEAFDHVRSRRPDTHLLLVGAGFAGDSLDGRLATRSRRDNVVVVGAVEEPAPYYALMDLLAFPSHREGFPNAPLEAAAAGIPCVGSRATGVTDVIVNGQTGALVEIGNAEQLSAALLRYVEDSELRREHGAAAALRVRELFAREIVWRNWRDEYVRLLRERGLPSP